MRTRETYGVHREVMTNAIHPPLGVSAASASVHPKPLIDLLQHHRVIRNAHQRSIDQLSIRLIRILLLGLHHRLLTFIGAITATSRSILLLIAGAAQLGIAT